MNPDRFKRRTDFSRQPPRKAVPVLDELGQLIQVPADQTTPVTPPPTPVAPIVQRPVAEAAPAPPMVVTPTPPATPPQPAQAIITPPVAPQPAQASAAPPAATVPPTTPDLMPPPTISVHISLPKMSLPKPKLPKLPKVSLSPLRKLGKWPLIAAGVVLLGVVGFLAFKHFHAASGAELNPAHAAASAALAKPNFAPAAPKGKPGLAIATAGTSAFDGTRDVYSYKDTMAGTSFVVSQQPLPAQFKSPIQAVTTVAKSINAKTPVAYNGGTAYMVTDSKSNAQTIVFSVKNLLVFIQSPFTHSAGDWVTYIQSLE